MPVPVGPNYPSLESLMNTVRAICNDSFAGMTGTAGEGQILADVVPGTTVNNPFILNHLNSAIREVYRKLRNNSTPTLIQDNYILLNLDIISGPLGAGMPDPTIQTYLDNTGYFYGTTYDTTIALPKDLLLPLRLWERLSGTTDTFIPMHQAIDGLPPSWQTDRLENWEWRTDRLNFMGATTPRDIRIRYQGVFPQFFTASMQFAATYVPIMDCEDAVAYLCAKRIAVALGSQAATSLGADAATHLYDLKNQQVRAMQQKHYVRRAFDDMDASGDLNEYGI